MKKTKEKYIIEEEAVRNDEKEIHHSKRTNEEEQMGEN